MKTRTRFWLVTLATVLAVSAGLALGRWQLGRADQKLALADAIARQGQLAPLHERDLSLPPASLWHRHAELSGEWLAENTVFLDNRQMDGRVGFFVVTPLRLLDGGGVLLVQRGWVARNFQDRTQLPQVPTPQGAVRLQLRLAPPPSKLYELGQGDAGPIRQNIDLERFGQEIRQNLLPLSGLQLNDSADGLLRHWPVPASDVDKHYGYAFQWFGLSALFTLLYVWFQIIAPHRRQRAR